MPATPNQPEPPPRLKFLIDLFKSDTVKEAAQFLSDATQKNPIEFAYDSAKDLFEGEGIQSRVVKGLAPFDTDEISRELANQIREIMSKRGVIEFAETMGALVTEPVLSIFEEYASKEDIDPIEFARSFHGAMILLGMPKTIGSLLDVEIAGTKLGDVGKALDSVYWSLGLGFLGWQTLAPLLSAGLQPRLERHYNKLYHPKRLALSDMLYLYLTDSVSLSKLTRFVEEEGYQPELTTHLIQNSFRSLNRGELEELYSLGKISKEAIYKQFIKQGYMPLHAQYFTDILTTKALTEGKEASLSKLREAYKKGLRTGSEFRDALETLGFSKEAISLELELMNYDKLHANRDLSVSQIKNAYVNGVLSKTDVLSGLREYGFNADDTNTLLQTWDAERKPKILKLNQSSIVKAYNEGVINQSQALTRLIDLGYALPDANIIIKTAHAAQTKTGFRLTLPMLMEARKINAVGQAEFDTRLLVEGLDSADAKIINALVRYEPTPKLTQLDVERAFKANVIPEQSAKTYLIQLGVTGGTMELKIKTWLAEKAKEAPKLSIGTLLLYYRQGIVDSVQLRSRLRQYGYDERDLDLFMKSANLALPDDLSRTEIRDLYLGDVIDRSRALALVLRTGLDQQEAEVFVKGLDAEIDNNRPVPTLSHYLEAVQNGIFTMNEFKTKLRELGYDTQAVNFYAELAEKGEKEATASLSKADILNAYAKDYFDLYTALERLMGKGYSRVDAELLLELKKPTGKTSLK